MTNLQTDQLSFLSGGGEMGSLIRQFDWGNSALGDPLHWPQSLKTAVRLLLSSGHAMFIWWGPELIQFYNDAYRRSIGNERHPSALGQGGRDCWQEIWPIISPQIEQVISGGGATWHENQLVPITRDGKREDVYWTYSYNPIDEPLATNGVGGVLVICTETTAQVMAHRQQQLAEARWRELFNQTPGFMCILNGPRHVFEFANPNYFKLLGGRDIIGKTLHEAIPEIADQGFQELLDDVYNTGIAYNGTGIPVSLLHEGVEQQFYLDFVYQPIFNAQGHITGIFVNGYDVTQREIASQTLKEEDRRKDEFLAMLAHELRNPLAPIRNASELIIHSTPQGSNMHATGELIARQVNHLTRLVDDLIDISRITQGKIELQLECLDLGKTIQQAIESLQSVFVERHHRLIYEMPPQPLFVNGDITRIIQCLSNVLSNAAKYTDAGGLIKIRLQESSTHMAVIDITDNGIGIASDVLPKIFELFVQADRTLDRSKGGLGIGLSIVRRLVNMHGGSVTAVSDGLGCGSRFEIHLPIAPNELIQPVIPTITKLASMRILIVDDNVDAADSLTMLLQLKGHDTITAYNAHEALLLAESFGPDIVLLDIGLPDIDGYEVVKRMQATGVRAKFIALTGYGKAEDIQRALNAGFDCHITKPTDLEKLEHILQRYHNAVPA